MGTKSPVDELVDGIDAIGSILDETLPQIKSRLGELANQQAENNSDINITRHASKELIESMGELRKISSNLDIHLEEVMGSIGALGRRMDQIQKSVLDLGEMVREISIDSELADTVKMLEDKIKKVAPDDNPQNPGFKKRF